MPSVDSTSALHTPWHSRTRLVALGTAALIQLAVLLALRTQHLEIPVDRAETWMDLLPVRPTVPPAQQPIAPHLSRQPTWRPSIARLPVLPTQADSPPGSRAAPDQGPTPPTVSAAPSTALDLSTDTLRRAIAEAARASDSVAAQAGGVTRLSQAERRDEALQESERQGCLTPVDKRKQTKSPIHLGGLLAIPGLVVDAATGQCSTH